MRNNYSIIAIVGITIAVLVIIAMVSVSVLFLDKRYAYIFEDNYGNRVNGEVYINENWIGRTVNGKLFTETYFAGELVIIVEKEGKKYYNAFDTAKSDEYTEVLYVVDYSEPLDLNLEDVEHNDYLNAILIDDPGMRSEATQASAACPSGDRECQIVSVFEHVINEYKYFGDSRDDEHIQSPSQTKEYGGGDCEDLSIYLSSLLENIGIETYFTVTADHAYLTACGVDEEILREYIIALFIGTEELGKTKETFVLDGGEIWYFGGDNTYPEAIMEYDASISASKPIWLFAVDNVVEYEKFSNDLDYTVIEGSFFEDVKQKDYKFITSSQGGIVIWNNNYQSVSITIDMDSYATASIVNPDELEITTYNLNGQVCVPMDPSVGEMGYVGFEPNVGVKKIFINTLTREQYEGT